MTRAVPSLGFLIVLVRLLPLGAQTPPAVPRTLLSAGGWRADKIAAGMDHCLWLKGDGTVWAWGRNSSGQLGSGNGTHLTPAKVSGLAGVVAIAGGGYHSLALKGDGTVWAWGYAAQGQ